MATTMDKIGSSRAEEPAESADSMATNTATQTTDEDHSDGADIRRQVEYYFSDDNLPTDRHLLECCGGRNNDPVSINRICGFKKMRKYKRKHVVEALRTSVFLEVSTDGKTIKRKIPLQGKCILDPDFYDEDEIAYDPAARDSCANTIPQNHPVKQQPPPGVSKNMMKPTGFESTHVEGPVTFQEARDAEVMFDPDRLYVERIELAIQCFKQKRRMHSMYASVFDKLMIFGGVNQGQRMHQGTSKQELAEMDAQDIARALATHHVPWERGDQRVWAVDFEGVTKGFLSSWYPAQCGYDTDTIKNACKVPRSFFNYLRYHNVCPEYDEQLDGALKICDLAEKELVLVNAALLALPGAFNKSASIMFGGAHADTYVGDQTWATEARDDGVEIQEMGLREEEARIIFCTGVAIMAPDEQYERLMANTLSVVKQEAVTLRIINIEPPTSLTVAAYAQQNESIKHKLNHLEPLGRLVGSVEMLPDYDEWDLPESKYPTGRPDFKDSNKEYAVWVEESVLQKCFIGMKLTAKVWTLDGGISFLDEITETMCSFYDLLPNELWVQNKPKEVRWLERHLEGEDGEGQDQDQDQGVESGDESQMNGGSDED